jgi:hypothetical protein
MTKEEINAVAVMRRAGNTPHEIAQTLGKSYTFALQAQRRAQQMGLLPPKIKPKPATRTSVRDFVCNYGMRQGRIGDVIAELSAEQQNWLLLKSSRLGCSTVAEYLTELVRDEFERTER